MASAVSTKLPDRDYRRVLLLASIFVVAACGLAYEVIAAAISSYLIGDAVTQFSLVVGAFLCAMGVGAYLSKHVQTNLLGAFVDLEIGVGVVGGISSIVMFAASVYAEQAFELVFYGLCVGIGVMVGAEIPILVRVLQNDGRELREALSQTLALDYVGALAGSVAVPLVALPFLGLSRVSIVFGLMNLGAAALGLRLLPTASRARKIRLVLALALLGAALAFSPRLVGFLEDQLYDDHVIYAASSRHQRIVLTRFHDDVRLYLDGHIQFSTVDEARYHEPLVHPAMESVPGARRVLVLGGGDGLAVREVLAYRSVREVTLVDLDPEMTRLARRGVLAQINEGSLRDRRVRVVNADALAFLRDDQSFYDVVIADLPDPSNVVLAKLYSVEFYRSALRRLSSGGAFVTHATSPFYARGAFWSIVATLEAAAHEDPAARSVHPYHVNVPSFGEWGFAIATDARRDPRALAPSIRTRYLNRGAWRAMFAFGGDEARPRDTAINELSRPTLHDAYRNAWQSY
jgi:spermidine synthase